MKKVTTSRIVKTVIDKSLHKTVSLLDNGHKKVWFISNLLNNVEVRGQLFPKLGYDPDNLTADYIFSDTMLDTLLRTSVIPPDFEIVICLGDPLNVDVSFIPNNVYVFHTR